MKMIFVTIACEGDSKNHMRKTDARTVRSSGSLSLQLTAFNRNLLRKSNNNSFFVWMKP